MGFWQARFEVLGSLQAQLDTPRARAITAALRAASTDRALLASFRSHSGELSRVSSASARLMSIIISKNQVLRSGTT